MSKNNIKIQELKRFAIMGGTFDPIHLGHLAAAADVLSHYKLEKIVFIPTGKPPHKLSQQITAKKHRLMMTILATESNPRFIVSDIEIKRGGTCYTVDTLAELRQICGNEAEIFFIVGADMLSEIPTWKEPERILELCELIAVSRNCEEMADINKSLETIRSLYNVSPHFLQLPDLTISATEIRNRISLNKPVRYFLPGKVEQYIRKHGLYLTEISNSRRIKMKVRRMVSEKRYRHTIGVAKEAARLAKAYGEDSRKAYIAGLLHDCGKEAVKYENKCREYGLDMTGIIDKELAHGQLGEKIAKQDFGITDMDILAAIRFHTTGRVGMSNLEKLIFVADLIEPYREPYPELDRIRKSAYKNLNESVLKGLKMKQRYTKQNGKAVDPLTLEAIKFYDKTEETYE